MRELTTFAEVEFTKEATDDDVISLLDKIEDDVVTVNFENGTYEIKRPKQ